MEKINYHKNNILFLYAVTLFALSILVTSFFWLVFKSSEPTTDYIAFYEPAARNFLVGNGFTIAEQPAIGFPCGYPFLLAFIFKTSDLLGFPETIALKIFTLFCVGIAAVLIFLIAQTIWKPVPALISGFVWVVHPLILRFAKQPPGSEVPFFTLFYGSFYLLWYSLLSQNHRLFIYFICGLLLGFAMLIRPIAIGLILVFCAIIGMAKHQIIFRFRLIAIIAVILGNLVAIAPWEAWVYYKTRKIIPLSTASVAAVNDGITFAVNSKGYRRGVVVPRDTAAVMKDAMTHDNELRDMGNLCLFLKGQLLKHPFAVLKLFMIKAARSWYGTDSNRYEDFTLLLQIPYIVLLLFSSLVAWQKKVIFRYFVIVTWLIISYFWAMTTISSSILRYMVPVIGLSFTLLPALFSKNER